MFNNVAKCLLDLKWKKTKQDIKLHRQFDPKLELIDYL